MSVFVLITVSGSVLEINAIIIAVRIGIAYVLVSNRLKYEVTDQGTT